jgi:hypothetical protein
MLCCHASRRRDASIRGLYLPASIGIGFTVDPGWRSSPERLPYADVAYI